MPLAKRNKTPKAARNRITAQYNIRTPERTGGFVDLSNDVVTVCGRRSLKRAWQSNTSRHLNGLDQLIGRQASSTFPHRCTSRPSAANVVALIRQARCACLRLGA